MTERPDGKGCGKPMGLSGHIACYCGQIGVPLCDGCKPHAPIIRRNSEEKKVLEELRWVMRNSEGVVGLTLDGHPLDWTSVARLYMPSLIGLLQQEPAQ